MGPFQLIIALIVLTIVIVSIVNVRRGYAEATKRHREPSSVAKEEFHSVLGNYFFTDANWWARVPSESLGYQLDLNGSGNSPDDRQIAHWLDLEPKLAGILRSSPTLPIERCPAYGNSPENFQPKDSRIDGISLFENRDATTISLDYVDDGSDFHMAPCIVIDSENCEVRSVYWCP